MSCLMRNHNIRVTSAHLAELLERYNTRGPRYTSYPTVPAWTETFTPQLYSAFIREQNTWADSPLSLYVHLPFCAERCLYCSCNVVITRQEEQADIYLDHLFREIDHVVSRMGDKPRQVAQLHWGGGTPTYLSPAQIERLFRKIECHFTLMPTAEIAIEIDPRVTTSDHLVILRQLGFNRVSLGVQDFDPLVQETIHRKQSVQLTADLVEECRKLQFHSINFDLIYGLPHQSASSFAKTLAEVVRLAPERIALYNYAHVPWLSPHQKRIPEEALPGASEKFAIFQLALETLLAAGYVYIGMDHFAKAHDDLALALESGRLGRNFMGYTVYNQKSQPDSYEEELYGFGCSAISSLPGCYAQNHKKLSAYYQAVTQNQLPTSRGFILSPKDRLHRYVIQSILCRGELSFQELCSRFGVEDPETYFANALNALRPAIDDELIISTAEGLRLTPLGRVFSRNMAMPFDTYLQEQQRQSTVTPLFSRTV